MDNFVVGSWLDNYATVVNPRLSISGILILLVNVFGMNVLPPLYFVYPVSECCE